MKTKDITLTITMTEEEFLALQYSAWLVGGENGARLANESVREAAERAWNIIMDAFYLYTTSQEKDLSDLIKLAIDKVKPSGAH